MKDDGIEKRNYKIILYGDKCSGKTSLLRQFIYHSSEQNFYTNYNYFFQKTMRLDNGKQLLIHFWDIFHLHGYESMNKKFFKQADGIMLTYDISNISTFERLGELLEIVIEYAKEDIPIALVACKTDLYLDEEVMSEEGEQFAENNYLIFYETSAKNNVNVDFSFNDFINRIINPNNEDNEIISIKNERPPKRGCLK